MDILLPEDLSTAVEYYPPKRPTSATVRFLNPSGTSLLAPTATVDTLNATIATVTDSETITVTVSAGSFVAGYWYWWVSADGQESLVLLGQKDSTTLQLEWPVTRSLPEVGDALKGARITATITAAAADTRGENYAIEWTTTCADSTKHIERQIAHVVRAQARVGVSPGFAKSCMGLWWPDVARTRTHGYFYDLARRAWDRVWRRLRRTGRYLHLLWDGSDFEAAGRIALQLELAHDGYIPGAVIDRASYIDALETTLNREIEDVVSSRPYDATDEGAVDASQIRTVNAIALRRV